MKTTMISSLLLIALSVTAETIKIDNGRQLFVDDYLIDATNGVVRYWNTPTKLDSPFLRPTSADGKRIGGCAVSTNGGLWWDPTIGKFRIWYEDDWCGSLLYAESADGIKWEEAHAKEIKATTIRVDSWSVWPDYKAANPYSCWKLFISTPGGSTKDYLFEATDGYTFKNLGIIGISGDRSTMHFDPIRNKWVFSLRDYRNPWGRARRFAEQDECKIMEKTYEWRKEQMNDNTFEPEFWTQLTETDYGKNCSLYNFDAAPYESLMVGVMEVLHNTPRDNYDSECAGLPKQTALRLAFSRDGKTYTAAPNEAIKPSGWGSGKWDTGYLSAIGGLCVIKDEKLWFYYSALRGDAARRREVVGEQPTRLQGIYYNGAIGAATLRRDGFAGMVADGNGEITTKPLTFTGGNLFINAECLFGEVGAEILNEDGTPITGFTAADCGVMKFDDSTKREITFKGGSLGALAGKNVRVRFKLHCATLYAFWVSPSKRGESRGYVAGGGPAYKGLRDE